MAQRYVLDFGSANAGGAPAWTLFRDLDSGGDLPQPAITEIGGGLYAFDYAPSGYVVYKAALNGTELSDVLQPVVARVTPVETAVGGANAHGRFPTAGGILNRVASELSLDEVPDPYTSSDPAFVQLRRALQNAAEELLDVRSAWPQLVRETSFVTVEGETRYGVPVDFHGMLDQTGWNRTGQLPAVGPVSPQTWQRLVASQSGAAYNVIFRLSPLEIVVFPVPAAGVQISYEYASRYWVQSAGASAPDATAPTSKDDTVLFGEHLITRATKLKFQQLKGFDTTATLGEYGLALSAALGRSRGAQKLSLNGPRHSRAVAANGGVVYL